MVTTAKTFEFDFAPVREGLVSSIQLSCIVDGETIWPVRGEADVRLEVQADDLLAYLTEFWAPLMLRQVYPLGLNPKKPSDLRRAADARWSELEPERIAKEEDAIFSFEEAHDLSTAFGGYSGLPSLWLMRSGSEYIVEAFGFIYRLPFENVRQAIETTGDALVRQLSKQDSKWKDAIAAWNNRYDVDEVGLLAWSIGTRRTVAQKLITDGTLRAPQNFEDVANDNDEMRVAARIVGVLPDDQIRSILALARQFDKGDAPALDALAADCLSYIEARYARSLPYVQGDVIARFVRERLRIKSDQFVDIFKVAADLGILVRTSAEEPQSLLGLAIWGSKHGPGVFLNEASTAQLAERGPIRMSERPVSRVTLAHELCHLLLDGDHALSAIEILQARMSVLIEQRAKHFAGEFLLPRAAAAEAWIKAKRPQGRAEVEAVVSTLALTYGVTRKVAAWKLEHGAHLYDIDLSHVLDSIEPYR